MRAKKRRSSNALQWASEPRRWFVKSGFQTPTQGILSRIAIRCNIPPLTLDGFVDFLAMHSQVPRSHNSESDHVPGFDDDDFNVIANHNPFILLS